MASFVSSLRKQLDDAPGQTPRGARTRAHTPPTGAAGTRPAAWRTSTSSATPAAAQPRTPRHRRSPARAQLGAAEAADPFWRAALFAPSPAAALAGNAGGRPTTPRVDRTVVTADADDLARMDDMLLTGVYVPSLRVQKLEALLSRELELWGHVVLGDNDGGGERDVGARVGTLARTVDTPPLSSALPPHLRERADLAFPSPRPVPDATEPLPQSARSIVVDAARTALIEIAERQAKQQQQQQQQRNRGHDPESVVETPAADALSSLRWQAPPAPSVAPLRPASPRSDAAPPMRTLADTPPRMRSPAAASSAAARAADAVHEQAASEKLRRLDAEVSAVDAECQRLLNDFVTLKHASPARDGADSGPSAAQVNELLVEIQRTLAQARERREKLLEMRHRLLQPVAP
jgi:hypothetical protein